MDPIHLTLIGINLFLISLLLYLFYRWEKIQRPSFLPFSHYLDEKLEDFLSHVDDYFQIQQKEMAIMWEYIANIHQDNISWRNCAKTLPPPNENILLLNQEKEELHGHLNANEEGWTYIKDNEAHTLSLEKITHWKAIFSP